MGLLDFFDAKETRIDKQGNRYEYNLTTKEIKKQNPGSIAWFRIGSAASTKEFEEVVKKKNS